MYMPATTLNINYIHESIPVGCVPPTFLVPVRGVYPTQPPDSDPLPPGCRPPPPGCRPPWIQTPSPGCRPSPPPPRCRPLSPGCRPTGYRPLSPWMQTPLHRPPWMQIPRPPPWTEWLTDASENITFLRAVIKYWETYWWLRRTSIYAFQTRSDGLLTKWTTQNCFDTDGATVSN